MPRPAIRLLALAAVTAPSLAGLAGCQSRLYDDNKDLHRENRELRGQIETLRGEQQSSQAYAPAPDPTPAPPPATAVTTTPEPATPSVRFGPPAMPPPQIEGVETSFDADRGEQTMRVAGDVLFASGQATVLPAARPTLDRVAEALTGEYAGRPVRVEGHTDRDPINKSRAKFATNDALSEARAQAVKDYLAGQGVEASRLTVVGKGSAEPRGGPKSADRRVEIIVVTG